MQRSVRGAGAMNIGLLRAVNAGADVYRLPLRVVEYARVSTASAAQRHSLDNQHETYRRLIAQTPAWTYAGAYTDAAVSGTKVSARSGFLRMIADAEAGRFDMIVVKDDCVIIEPTQKDLENQGSVAGSVCFLTRNKEIFNFIT